MTIDSAKHETIDEEKNDPKKPGSCTGTDRTGGSGLVRNVYLFI